MKNWLLATCELWAPFIAIFVIVLAIGMTRFSATQLPPDVPLPAVTHITVLWTEQVSMMSAVNGIGTVDRVRVALVKVDSECYTLIGASVIPTACPVAP